MYRKQPAGLRRNDWFFYRYIRTARWISTGEFAVLFLRAAFFRYNGGMKIAVIGAGASGMMAALQAARVGAAVSLFERNASVGRKVLVTGSGRCNITNDAAAAGAYACADPRWMETLLGQFGVTDLLTTLAGIGVLAHKTADGWYYPLSESARTVVDAFDSALRLAGVELCALAQVTAIQPGKGRFTVRFLREDMQEERLFDRVIVCAGGAAYPSLGSRGELFPALARLGHTILPNRPALAPVLADLGDLQPLEGVRLDLGAAVWKGDQCLGASRGNAIFTKWGLNGPAVMDISHHVSAHPPADLRLSLDLLAFFREEFDQLLARSRQTDMPLRVFLGAFFPPKVSATFAGIARVPEDTAMKDVSDRALRILQGRLADTRLRLNGVRGFEYCQVSAGGVPVGEVDPVSMQSRRVPGLYLAGETLDVVGPCGGYNLQYAFSSGAVAGRSAAGAG